MKTREQFIAQFPNEITNAAELTAQGILRKEQDYQGVEVYRALQKILIKVGEKYYTHW